MKRSGGRRRRDLLVVGAGLVLGIGVSVFADDVSELVRGDTGSAVRTAEPAAPGERQEFSPVVADRPAGEEVAATPAATPSQAVERFLAAEVERDHERSFALLSAAGRSTYDSPAAWRASHASFFPVSGFDVRGVNDAGTSTSVVVDMRYASSLDEVLGLVPARAEVTWPVVKESGGWLVDFDGAGIDARFPAEDGAAEAARTWATARQSCDKATEYSAGLVGAATLAERLCRAKGRLVLGPVSPLDSSDNSAMVSAFGAPAAIWARTVRISGPVELTAVLAPVDDRWLVVGIVAPR